MRKNVLGGTAAGKASVVKWCERRRIRGSARHGEEESRGVFCADRKPADRQGLGGWRGDDGCGYLSVPVLAVGNALGMIMANKYTAYRDVLRKIECLHGVRKVMKENGFEECFQGKDLVHGDYMEFVVNTLTTY